MRSLVLRGVLVLVLMLCASCASSAGLTESLPIQTLQRGANLDNVWPSRASTLAIEGIVFTHPIDVVHFTHRRATFFQPQLFAQAAVYTSAIAPDLHALSFDETVGVLVVQEGVIHHESTIAPIEQIAVTTTASQLTVHVRVPQPTRSPCQQPALLTWLFGPPACTSAARYVNTYHLVTLPKKRIPGTVTRIQFVDQDGIELQRVAYPARIPYP